MAAHLTILPTSLEPLSEWESQCPTAPTGVPLYEAKAFVIYTDGSFDGTNSAWAFHVSGDWGLGSRSLGWFGARVELDAGCPAFLGAQKHGALQGELSALFWSVVWVMPLLATAPVTIYSDCTTAIGATGGYSGHFRGPDIATRCRQIMQAARALPGGDRLDLQHVKSHVGHAGNEVADYLAKACCRNGESSLAWNNHPVCQCLQKDWLQWLWLYIEAIRSPQTWPQQSGGSLVDVSPAPAQLPSAEECEAMLGLHSIKRSGPSRRETEASINATFLTVNVQSLHPTDGEATPQPHRADFPGRAGILREQLDAWHVSVAALQETRAPRNETVQSRTHIRFCSARDEQWSYGTELWFSKTVPFVFHALTPILFQLSDFLVVHWDPRIIAARFSRGPVRLLFVSLHAPTNASPLRHQWWADFRLLLNRLRQGSQVVLLGDFNLHINKAYGDRIGDLHWHTSDPPPEVFWDLLDGLDLWVPSTFGCCHPGPSETWKSPSGQTMSRLDYIALPVSWQVPSGGSAVVPELEWGQSHDDHYALLVKTTAGVNLKPPTQARKGRLDTQAMRTPEGKARVRQICAALPDLPWDLDVHRHAAKIEEHFRQHLPIAFPAPKARQIKPQFQSDTWQLRNQRSWQRKRVHNAGHFGRSLTTRLYWGRWKLAVRVGQVRGVGGLWARFLRTIKELPTLIKSLRETSVVFRASVRRDTKAYLHAVAVQATSDPTSCVVQRLKQLTGGPKRKQRGAMPLPAVELKCGRLAQTNTEAKDRWIEHFATIEDGKVESPVDFVHACYRRQAEKDLSGHLLELEDIPCRTELAAALRAASTDRAYGLDELPGEVLRYGAAEISRSVYALLLKSVYRLSEPVQHKGGTLYCIWKGKGPKQSCGSYRGILVSSMLGKSIHKTLRGRCTDVLASSAVPLQVGGLPRFPVTVPAQAARLFQSACFTSRRSHAILFLDLQEAFYRIIRPLITGERLSDEQVAHVCAAVQLPAGTMHDLRSFLGGDPLLASAGSSQWAAGAVSETLHDTWFRLPQEEDIVVTRTGSRPGDSLSDLVFSFLFACVLRQVRESLHQAGALAQIPWNPAMEYNLEQTPACPDRYLGISDATWMDDLAMFLTSPSACSLLTNLKIGASALIDACLRRALVPNLSRGKTEAILHVNGYKARQVRSQVFGTDAGHVPLDCEMWDSARLRVVPIYKHLGGYLQHNGGLRHEVSFRISQAWDAFNKRKKKLFHSPLVSAADKSVFFTSLVSTVMFHGAGTWTQISDRNTASLDAALRQMACQMLYPRVNAREAWHLGASQALALAGVPQASTYLHVARLRHVLACFQLKVIEIWALAHWEKSWLQSVRDSVRWLWEQLDGGQQYPAWDKAWAEWRQDCREHPGRWKAKIRRALARALQRERWQATMEHHFGLLAKQLHFKGAFLPHEADAEPCRSEVCACCGVVFGDFRAWSVHAFKCHGRVDEARSLVDGLQCPHCLKHFATNIRLCRHVRHTPLCRRALLSGHHRTNPVPGIGSRKAPKEHLFCAPALQAAGPKAHDIGDYVEDEFDRPSAEVLDCLALLDFDGIGQNLDQAVVWDRIKQAFSCVCLPVRRLKVTAEVWLDRVTQGTPDVGANSSFEAFLRRAAKWVLHADFVNWLVPSPAGRATSIPAFRHCAASLALLDLTSVQLPTPLPWTCDHVLVCVGQWPPQHLEGSDLLSPLLFPHEESLLRISEGKDLEFFCSDPNECGFFLSTCGLPCPAVALEDYLPQFEDSLPALRLSGDILRFALKLWSSGIRTCLQTPWPGGEDTALLRRIEGIRFLIGVDRATFWVGPPSTPLDLFHLV